MACSSLDELTLVKISFWLVYVRRECMMSIIAYFGKWYIDLGPLHRLVGRRQDSSLQCGFFHTK